MTESAKLTKREQEVAGLVVQGLSSKEIGEKLGLTKSGVGTHLYKIFRKCGVKNRVQLILKFAGKGAA